MDRDLFGVCPFATAQRLIQGKWAILILHHLSEGTLRFNELQRKLPKMTHATLSAQLKQLEAEGLVIRTEHPQIPPRVEYSLSELGESMRPIISAMEQWGRDYQELVQGKGPSR